MNTLARAGVRAGAGAIDGALGAAVVEPFNLYAAQAEQRDYSVTDSFLNVAFGGVLGGGLHVPAGAIYDYRGGRAARGVEALIARLAREDAAEAVDAVHLERAHDFTKAIENDVGPPPVFDAPKPLGKPRSAAPLMPEGTLAREVQDLQARVLSDDDRAAARAAHRDAGGKIGDVGPIHEDLRGNYVEGIRRLAREQDGEVPAALHHEAVGDIDIIWGTAGSGRNDGLGLAKIAKYHPEVIDDLPAIIKNMRVRDRSERRVRLESPDHEAAINLDLIGSGGPEKKTWLLTAYAKKGDKARRQAVREQAYPRGRTDTAPPAPSAENVTAPGSKFNQRAEDLAADKAAQRAAAEVREPTVQEVAGETQRLHARLDDMRARGLLDDAADAELNAADDVAAKMEAEADAYEAAAAQDDAFHAFHAEDEQTAGGGGGRGDGSDGGGGDGSNGGGGDPPDPPGPPDPPDRPDDGKPKGRGFISGDKGVLAAKMRASDKGDIQAFGEIEAAKAFQREGRSVHFRKAAGDMGIRGETTSDLLVDGAPRTGVGGVAYEVFTPNTDKAKSIASALGNKVQQADRIILNLDNSTVTAAELTNIVYRVNSIPGVPRPLREVIVVRNGRIVATYY